MLTVTFGTGGELEKNHHVGEKSLRMTLRSYAGAPGLWSVFADGDELMYIRDKYCCLAIVSNASRTCEWTGDLARFILLNWKE